MNTADTHKTSIMAHNNGTDLNFLKFHIKGECSATNIKVEEVDEHIIKTETEISGGLWVYQNVDINKLLANENRNLRNSEEQWLNQNSGIKKEILEDDSKTWEKVNNLSTNCQKNNENGLDFSMDFNGQENVLQQDFIESMKINNTDEKEKLKFLHDDNDCLSTGTLEKRVLMSQKTCEKDVVLYQTKYKKQKSERNNYNPTEKKHKCNECSYAAVRKYVLLHHISSRHTLEKPFKCNECSYAAVLKDSLLYHVRSHHSKEKPYGCSECSYAAVNKSTLVSHIKARHTMEKPYTCTECSYAAVRKQELLCHVRSHHTLEKPFKCSICSYAAVQKNSLLSHIRSRHSMEKPYKCNECSYAAVKKCHLLAHIKFRHTMEKSYKCDECSYAAVQKGTLLSHIRSHHSMEKPYKCNECSYSSAQKRNLLSHVKSHHSMEKPFEC